MNTVLFVIFSSPFEYEKHTFLKQSCDASSSGLMLSFYSMLKLHPLQGCRLTLSYSLHHIQAIVVSFMLFLPPHPGLPTLLKLNMYLFPCYLSVSTLPMAIAILYQNVLTMKKTMDNLPTAI